MDEISRQIEMIKILTKCHVLKVEDCNSLSNWLWELSYEIGIKPYKAKKQKLKSDLNLEIEGNKGKDLEDTFLKMLKCLPRVGEAESKAIAQRFPTINHLFSAWDSLVGRNDLVGAEDMLVGCKKGNSNKAIGKITSKKIFDVFYSSKDGDTCINNN
ncbi:uncharacterized protein MELLADRAFT_72281 [Melampsora larici-populina 98AG31]|uniref:Crossover junction endonuclease MUS81 n=1 Tax=Melampsora larici-populina (strain 98AG31 / pathotype 3-4-7) TaxID=747676 RepID=F4RRW3_MELLP|nr:uncharacterized protein MELLADRAFT_72281 [Melampsora larici-populina 98AG31]EGG04749.1 hypothetical protein MELLADRAFT_72281 [Melampsora larici-populina 98AG31]